MISPASLLTLAVAAGSAQATFTGFNYGNLRADGSVKAQADYEAEFKAAANLPGTNGIFRSGRIYTMIQGGTPNSPNAAIPAAISTKTSLLFGLWASAGQDSFNNELAALQGTIQQYCGQLDGLVAGISVGSEDLYRDSALGKKNSNGLPGANAETIVNYINEVRKATKGSCLEKVPVGHVDTWTAYVDDANKAVVDACDWLGMDTYPYFENDKPNGIDLGRDLYVAALNKVKGAGGGKEVWITETGWPISGKTSGAAVPNKANSLRYWQDVGCPAFGKDNIWWYDLQDFTSGDVPNFGVLGADLNGPTNFDLSCKGHENPPVVSTSAAAPSSTAKSSEAPASKSSAPAQQSSAPASSSHGSQASSSAGAPTTLQTASGSASTNGASQPTDSNQSSSSATKTGAPSTVPTASGNSAGKATTMGAAAVAAAMAFALLHFALLAACLLALAAFVAAAPQTVMPSHVLDSMSLEDLDDHLQTCPIVQQLSAAKSAKYAAAPSSATTRLFSVLFPGSPAVNALLATLYISGPPNFLLALCPTNIDPSSLSVMVAFAVGGLLGDTLFHLLPEIFLGEDSETQARFVLVEPNRNLVLGLAILVGFMTFVAMDKGLRIATAGSGEGGHSHGHSHSHAHNGDIAVTSGSDAKGESSVKSRKGKKGDKDAAEEEPTKEINPSVKLGGYLNLIADFTHNITDGLAMSASFYASPTIGATTTVAVFFHEIPHEVGDFALLVQSGFSKRAAMGSQFITAIGALLGTLIGIAVQEFGGPGEDAINGMPRNGGLWGTSLTWGDLLLPFTAGTFLYVGTVAVIPELLETSSGNKMAELRKTLVQFAAVAFGAGIMLYISWHD